MSLGARVSPLDVILTLALTFILQMRTLDRTAMRDEDIFKSVAVSNSPRSRVAELTGFHAGIVFGVVSVVRIAGSLDPILLILLGR